MNLYIFLLLFVSLIFKSLYADNSIFYDENKSKKILNIKGQYIEYINKSFNDYKKLKVGPFRNIKYYNFLINDMGGLIDISIGFNYELMKKDLHYSVKGGGGKYTFDKNNLSIKERELYK